MAPRLTAYNGQRANVTVLNQLSYISDFDVEIAHVSIPRRLAARPDGLADDVRTGHAADPAVPHAGLVGGPRLAGLVLVSYPLHPPGKPDRLRVEHLPAIGVPCLFVSGTRDAFGALDILVNNAGTILRAPAAEHPDEYWDKIVEVNLNAQFVLSREFGKDMVARGSGKIIFTASLLTFQGGITVPGYAASKGGIGQLTMALANQGFSGRISQSANTSRGSRFGNASEVYPAPKPEIERAFGAEGTVPGLGFGGFAG